MTTFSTHHDTIRAAVRGDIEDIVGTSSLPLYDMVRYHLGLIDSEGRPAAGGGKMLRPLFCCLACEAVGGDWQRALPAATALELTHNFTLVHDDIEDGDLERHHQPTVWARWGLEQGINAGDAIWVLAWQALARLTRRGISAETAAECMRRLAARCRTLTEGQYLDLALEGEAGGDIDEYVRIVTGKTGALLACCFELGALCGGAGRQVADQYGEAGSLLGIGYQMDDDILGTWGDPAVTGKPAGGDVRRKKMSLPAVYAFEHLSGASLASLRGFFRSEGPLGDAEVEAVLDLYREMDVREATEELARGYAARARRALEGLPVASGNRTGFVELARSLAGRRM